jgi:Uma2 family endonuclease
LTATLSKNPCPKGRHSIIQAELSATLNSTLRRSGIATAFPELRCTFGERSIVPDIAVFEDSRIPRAENGEVSDIFTTAPDWVIEILSPEQGITRVLKNITHCLVHETQMGWMITLDDRSVIIYQSGQGLRIIDEKSAVLPVPPFASAVQLTLDELFGWLK